MSYRLSYLSIALLCASGSALAQQTDARAIAMGGTGVAGASYHQASFYNPALLTHFNDSDDFALVLPAISASVADNDELIDGIDNLQDALDRLDINPTAANSALAKQALTALDNNSANMKVTLAMAAAIPNNTLPVAIFARGHLDANVLTTIDASDIDRLNNNNTDLLSSGSVIAVGVVEAGITIAHAFTLDSVKLSVGASPKFQQIETFFYNSSVADFDEDDFDADQYRNKKTQTNIDLGVTAAWENGVVLGVSAKNLLSKKVPTIQVKGIEYTYDMKPQYTVAANYHNSWFSANIDAELNSHTGFGLQDEVQWLAAGVEFNALNWAQLRLGYRNDLKNNQQNQLTAGLGLSPFDTLHIDLAAVYADKNDAGAALSLAFTF